MTMTRSLPAVAACVAAWLVIGSVLARADDLQGARKLYLEGQQAEALDQVNAYLKSSPTDAQARFLKGLILTKQNRQADAIQVYQSMIEDYPELPEPYNNLAVLYAAQGRYESATASLEMAIRAHPGYATAHENLGDIRARIASQSYERAAQLDSSNTSAKAKLAVLQDMFAKGELPGPRPSESAGTLPAR